MYSLYFLRENMWSQVKFLINPEYFHFYPTLQFVKISCAGFHVNKIDHFLGLIVKYHMT